MKGEKDTSSCKTPRCTCFAEKGPCSRVCRCKLCANQNCNIACSSVSNATKIRCCCHKSPVACEISNNRQSRCPCLRNGRQCSSSCKCKNCGNSKPVDVQNAESRQTNKRKRNQGSSFQRQKGCDYLAKQGFDVNYGTWTELEMVVLITI